MPSAGAERPSQAFGRPERNAEARVLSIAISPDAKVVVAVSLEGRLLAWSAESPGLLWKTSLRGGSAGSQSVWFAPNGELVLALGGRLERRRLFEERGRVVWAFGGEADTRFAFNGSAGVIAGPVGIARLDVENGRHEPVAFDRVALLRRRPGAIRAVPVHVAVSASGRTAHVLFHLIAREGDRPAVDSLRLVTVDLEGRATHESLALPAGLAEPIRLTSLDDGRSVFLTHGGPPVVLEADGSPRPLADAGRRTRELVACSATPDGGFLAAGRHGGALWHLETGALRAENRALTASSPAIARAGGIVATAQINTVALFSTSTLSRLAGTAAHGGGVRSVIVSPRGRAVFSSDTHTLRAWHAQTTEPMWETGGSLLAVSPDASRVAALVCDSATRARLAILDAASGDRVEDAEVEWVEAACFREDGVLLAAARTAMTPGAAVRLAFCEGAEMREAGRTQVDAGYDLGGCAFTRDGSAFLVSHQATSQTLCFDVPSGALRWTAQGGLPVPSPDGAFVALTTHGPTGIQIVEMASGQPKGHVTLESWRVIAWGSGDVLLAISGEKDPRCIRLARRELQSQFASLDPVWLELEAGNASAAGAFFPDGTRVVVGEERGTLRLWRVDSF